MENFKVSGDTLGDSTAGPGGAKTVIADTVPEAAQEAGKVDPEKKIEDEEDESQYPSTKVVAVVMIALYMAMFLVALVS